jgi:uncharacterized membrane protein YeiB
VAVTATGRAGTDTKPDAARLPGPDVVRAVALIGVVLLNVHGYLTIRGGPRGGGAVARFFDPWSGPLATRFAATFVLVAGVGVTLYTRRARHDRATMTAKQWSLVRRGLVLYGGGLVLDMVWRGTILPYYGAMFVLAALLCALGTRWVVAVGAAGALAGAGVAWWSLERRLDGHDTSWLSAPGPGSPRGLLLDTFVNGTHPLLPWLAFFCAGIVLGRVLHAPAWRAAVLAAGFVLFGAATMAGSAAGAGPRAELLSVDPSSRALPYTLSALGTALIAFGALTWVAEQFRASAPVRLLRDAGAMSLTLYVAHALVFLLVVDRLGWVRPTGLDTALLFTAGYWVVAIAAGAAWHRRFGIGPVEWVYRQLGG